MKDKGAIREEVRARRRAIDHVQRRENSIKLHNQLCGLDEYKSCDAIALYAGSEDEVMTAPLIARVLGKSKRVALPRVEDDKLGWRWVTSISQLAPGSFSILEPKPELEIALMEDFDIVIVPGVAFDRRGHRIGYGVGFYDRALADYKGLSISLAFDCQMIDEVPYDEWDVPLDIIITPTQIIRRPT